MSKYAEFIASKALIVPSCGFEPQLKINPQHFPMQQEIDRWALRRGRAAILADCGLGKTPMQLEIARHVQNMTGGKILVLAPLAVGAQTVREGNKFGVEVRAAASQEDCSEDGIYITNYQKLHRFDHDAFDGIVLDESSILKADGKTKRELCSRFNQTPYRFAFTATPAPNDFEELGNHAEFLGIMSRTEMLATWFCHDGGDTSEWRLKGHAEQDFWRWVCSWAMCVRKPSDLGYPDGSFVLPELRIVEHILDSDATPGMLFSVPAKSLNERRSARRSSMAVRINKTCEIIESEPNEPWVVWCNLNPEGDALKRSISRSIQVSGADSDKNKEAKLIAFSDGSEKRLITKSQITGYGLNWQHCARAIVYPNDSYEQFYQLIRRFWRYGQSRRVDIHVVLSEAELAILTNLRRKHEDHEKMAAGMLAAMKEIQRANVQSARRETEAYNPTKEMRLPEWVS